jgi:hypothetical protein
MIVVVCRPLSESGLFGSFREEVGALCGIPAEPAPEL